MNNELSITDLFWQLKGKIIRGIKMNRNLRSYSFRALLLGAICLFISVGQALPQSTTAGGISGKVVDQQGALIPDATVTVTNTGTNRSENVTATGDATFRFTNLQPGTYTVDVTAQGFADFRSENVLVEVGKVTTVNASLGITGANVEVTVEAPVVNTVSQEFNNNINQTAINELPINGRRASNFVLLTPGVAPDGDFGLISFRGISGLLNNSTLDGGDNNQAFFSEERGRTRISSSISQDAVREFQVNTSNYSAEFGRSAGGVINTVTKSGENDFHGSAFYYLRNSAWSARNPFSFQNGVAIKPKDERHQFGGSIGGPIVKDKLFFFFSYDQQKRDFPAVATTAVPSFLDPITVTPGSTLDMRGISQAETDAALNFLRGLTGVVARKGDQILILPKIDWIINDDNRFSISYNRMRWESPGGVQTQAVVFRGTNSFGSDFVDIDTLNGRLNTTISPSVLNEFRFQYTRELNQQTGQEPGPGEPTTAPDGGVPDIGITGGGFDIGRPNFLPRTAFPLEKNFQIADSVTVLKGNHTLKFGGDVNHVNDVIDNLFQGGGEYRYNNLVDFITDFADPSQQRYSFFAQAFGPSVAEFSTTDFSFFVQDDIRITPRLMLNLGLRYEFQSLPEPQRANPLEPRTASFPSDNNNFGPRFGLAYDVSGDGNTSIRGGYGIYYGRLINSTISNAITNTGGATGVVGLFFTGSSGAGPLYPNVAPPPPAGATGGNIIVFSPEFENPLIHQADVVFEHTIARNTVVSVSGLFSWGRNLPTFVDSNLRAQSGTRTYSINGGPFDGQTVTVNEYFGPRPDPNFGAITEIRSTIESSYAALVLQIRRRLTDGLQFNANYTYSDSEDNGQTSITFTSQNVPSDPNDLSREEGKSRFHIPHRFVASLVYAPETLFGLGQDNKVAKAILSNWSVAPIVTIQSGRTYDAGIDDDLWNTAGSRVLPGITRNSFQQPYIANVDLRLSRRFQFAESMSFEFLAEAFNLFNRFNVTNVNNRAYNRPSNNSTDLNFNSGFGMPTSAGNNIFRERQVQLSGRFQF
ncbi:MAG TPA: TonB-dependent receptor [Aridibacter sp.]|nr:TonB-dependent receptor [Aridibacter sp.]